MYSLIRKHLLVEYQVTTNINKYRSFLSSMMNSFKINLTYYIIGVFLIRLTMRKLKIKFSTRTHKANLK